MKYIILIVLTLTLNAETPACKYVKDSLRKHYQLFNYAYEDRSKARARMYGNLTLHDLEQTMVHCEMNPHGRKKAEALRTRLRTFLDKK